MPRFPARSRSDAPNLQYADRASHDESAALPACIEQVAHDLRSPICAVRGLAYLLERECATQLGTQGRDYLDRLQLGIDRMGKLIDELVEKGRV